MTHIPTPGFLEALRARPDFPSVEALPPAPQSDTALRAALHTLPKADSAGTWAERLALMARALSDLTDALSLDLDTVKAHLTPQETPGEEEDPPRYAAPDARNL